MLYQLSYCGAESDGLVPGDKACCGPNYCQRLSASTHSPG